MLPCSIVCLEALLRSEQARGSLGGRLLIFAFSAQILSAVVRISLVLSTDAQPGWLQSQTSTHAQLGLVYASAALLIGSIGLFLILGLIMYATRNVDWYDTGARDRP
jgi:hypothetical protein